jgi:signal transduction histidine kinase
MADPIRLSHSTLSSADLVRRIRDSGLAANVVSAAAEAAASRQVPRGDRGANATTGQESSGRHARLADVSADVAAIRRINAIPSMLEVICRTTGMGFAVVARVTDDRWIVCAVRDEISFGLQPGGELKIETTICDEIRDSRVPVIIDHVDEDPDFREHHTPRMYGFQSYISMPIFRSDGSFFGTLCAIDPKPARLNRPEVAGMFRLFADLVAFYLDAQERAATNEAALWDERQTAELREQFIAVLGHDLRNPLASIEAGSAMLLREGLSSKGTMIIGHVQTSVKRMSGLINDMLDFARGRLGGGFQLVRDPHTLLAPLLEQVVGELQTAWPDNAIETNFAINHAVNCDPNRIAQLASNLVGNALKHGALNRPVRVAASTNERDFELSVANEGDPIEPAVLGRLFQPFFRVAHRSMYQGLGLGLYIASEVARAHGGQLEVESTSERTRFTLRMPRD